MVFTVVALGAAAAVTLLLGYIAISSLQDSLETEKAARLKDAANSAQHLDEELGTALNNLTVIAGLDELNFPVVSPVDQQRVLIHAFKGQTSFWAVALVDTHKNIALTYPQANPVSPAMLHGNWLEDALSGAGPQVSEMPFVDTEGRPRLGMASPITGEDGVTSGALVGFIDLSHPYFMSDMRDVVVGRTGYSVLAASDGTIVASSDPRRVLEKSHLSESFAMLLQRGQPALVIYPDDDQPSGQEVVAMAPLSSTPMLFAIEQDEGEFLAPLRSLRFRFVVGGLALVALVLIITAATSRVLARPLRRLSRAASLIALGDLETRVPTGGFKEITDLGLAFEGMQRQVNHRTRELATVYSLATVVGQSPDLDIVLGQALDRITQALHFEARGGIFLLDAQKQELVLRAQRGLAPDFTCQEERVKVGECLCGLVAQTGMPLFSADSSHDDRHTRMTSAPPHSHVIVPLKAGDEVEGVLFLYPRPEYQPSAADWQLLTSIGGTLGIALANARLYKESQTKGERLERSLSQQGLSLKVMERLNNPGATEELVRDVVLLIKEHSGCQAVGIRLQEGEDFPYYVANGFLDGHVAVENFLCARGLDGQLLRDETGNPVLECMCGNIIQGRFDPEQPFFTQGGSFWTNSTTELLATTTDKDLQARTRNRCNSEGYESVAIIPLTGENGNIGLLQLNDSYRDHFSQELIEFYEGIAQAIGVAISHQRTETERGTLESIIASMGEGLVVTDGQFNIAYCNPAAEETLDIRAEDVIGQPLEVFHNSWMGRVSDLETLSPRWEEAMKFTEDNPEVEFEILSGARKRTVEAILFPVGQRGARIGTGVLLRDVTREREVDRMKTEFISLASHELRTPMTVVYGFAELLLKSQELPEEQREWLGRIYQESKRLSNIVDDLLDVSRIEMGRLSLDLKGIALEPLITDLVARLRSNYPSHPFRADIPRDFPEVRADAAKFTQVVYNLLDNAAKYSPQGGQVTVSASIEKDSGLAVIAVADRGMGIPEDEVPHLFTRFHRIRRPETEGVRGTGLGLYIVKSLVEMMGGKVWANSKLDQGSTFYIALPLASDDPEEDE